tara:strand:+ start:213 stop:503 length:291 start_codon:yes stop_codon:yes gene_type:complete
MGDKTSFFLYNGIVNIMPIHEYKCSDCNQIFEYFQKISDNDLKICLCCGSKGKVSKLISPSGFRLKGSGWYETDFKKKNDKNQSVTPKKDIKKQTS